MCSSDLIRIKQGDIFVKKTDQPEDQFEIARKPPHVLLAMLQPVSDTKHQPRPITEGIVPDPWQPEALSSESQSNIPNWNRPSSQEGTGKGKGWSATVSKVPAGQLAMLRYRHRVMTPEVLQQLEASPNNPRNAESQKKIKDPNSYRLISDFTWYNHSRWMSPNFATPRLEYDGTFWVGDLAGEWDFKTEPGSEALHLLLVEGGVEFRCVIDLKTGIAAATAEFEGAKIAPFATGRERANQIEAKTSVRAGSRHRIRFANIDDALTLWVDGKVVPWATSGAYNIELAVPGYKHLPVVKESDPMDAAPLGIGVVGGGCSLERAQVFRDIYYIAPGVNEDTMLRSDYQGVNRAQTLAFQDWPTYDLGPDDYFPMGDNSRASSDARLWKSNSQPGRLMIGRALMVFWPHYWYLWNRIRPIPNFSKFRFIR